MELSDVYVNDNELDKFHQNYCHAPPKAWPARWRIVVHTYIQLCVNACVIGIVCTRSTTTFWFVLDVPRISLQTSSEQPSFIINCTQRNDSESFIYKKKSNKLFHSPGDTLPPIFWKNYSKAENNKDTSMEARKLAEKKKREQK